MYIASAHFKNRWWGQEWQIDRLRASKNPFLLKGNENPGKNGQNHCFRILEIKQMLTAL